MTRWGAVTSWVAGTTAFGFVWGQERGQVLHPHYLPLLLLFTVMLAAAALSFITGLWRVVAGPKRLVALAWAFGSKPSCRDVI